jgi:hypothetical protein
MYEIAELGLELHAQLESLERAVQKHGADRRGRAIAQASKSSHK